MEHIFFNNPYYYHLTQNNGLGNWVGIAGIVIGVAAVIIALWTLYTMRYMWQKDRKIDTEIDKKIKRLLIKELKENKGIANYLLSTIENYKKGTPIPNSRCLGSIVFNSIINSHRLVRFLSDTSIDKLFDINHTAQSINGLIALVQASGNWNTLATFPEAESWLKELTGYLDYFLPILEKENVELK